MKITKVFVRYGRTFSLPGYSNVKPEEGYEAEIEPGEDVAAVKAELLQMAQAEVEEACDQALEEAGERAHFWTGPRYNLRVLGDDGLVVIIPNEVKLPESWGSVHCPKSGWRLEALRKYTQEMYGKLDLVDLSENPEALPEVQEYEVVWLTHGEGTYCLLLPADFDIKLLPNAWQNYHRTRYTSHTRLAANFLPWIEEQVAKKEATLIDCLDGDLSKLPEIGPKEPVEQAIADGFIPDIEFDDDDDDGDEDYYDGDDDDNGEDEVGF
jgi:hypothetical protein